MTDPANCGPVCLAFCQDTQAEAYDYPIDFFEPRIWHIRRPEPDQRELEAAVAAIQSAKKPADRRRAAAPSIPAQKKRCSTSPRPTTSPWSKPNPARARWIGRNRSISAPLA
jgi:hypothetical protein